MQDLKTTAQAEALGEAKRLPSQRDWGVYISVLSIQCSGGRSLPGDISDSHSPVERSNSSPWPKEADDVGVESPLGRCCKNRYTRHLQGSLPGNTGSLE